MQMMAVTTGDEGESSQPTNAYPTSDHEEYHLA